MVATVGRLIKARNVQLLMVGAVAAFAIDHGLSNWMPTILVSHSFSLARAGIWAAIATGAGLLGSLAIPRSVRPERRRYLLAAIGVVTFLAAISLGLASGEPLMLAVIAAGTGQAVMGPLLILLLMETSVVGRSSTGAAIGLYYTFGEMGGFAGPFLIGILTTLSGSFVLPLALLSALALLIAVLALTLSGNPASRPSPG
jgi:cyanate permease